MVYYNHEKRTHYDLCFSPGDVRRQVPVRLVQEDLHALRHLLLQQPRLRCLQVLRLNATPNEPDTTTQQELFFNFIYQL